MRKRHKDNTIGIDVSKDTLDVCQRATNEYRQFANDVTGFKPLICWLQRGGAVLIVFEASGAYHRQLERHLAANSVPYFKVNQRQARRFAEATGRLAKTDRVDAELLAKMGAVLGLEQQQPQCEYLSVLKEMIAARRALIKERASAKTRLQTTTQTILRCHLRERLAQVKKHLNQIDQTVMELIVSDELLAERFEILISIPGIGQTTAFSMLIEMPELGSMSGKQAACLAGLAPISRQSGRWQGKERIQGGRAFFRRAMYMPALCTIRHDLSSRGKYNQLIQAGKPPKVALTAIMRKLVVVANALLRDGRRWSENRA